MNRWGPRVVVVCTLVAVLMGTFLLPAAAPVEPLFVRLNGLAFATVGLLATRRVEGRRVGWLCLAIGATSVGFDVLLGLAETRGPGAVWAYWAGTWLSQSQPILLLVLLPALFPSGHALGPRWRWLVPTSLVVLFLAVVTAAFDQAPFKLADESILGVTPIPWALPTVLEDLVLVGGFVCVVAAVLSLAVRYRRSRGVERQQLRWLFAGIAATVTSMLCIFVAFVAGVGDGPVVDAAFGLTTLTVPASMGVALTRHGLYDLGRVVSRTVAYALVAAVAAAAYFGSVVVLSGLARTVTGESGELVVALSTLAVAAIFQPVRRRVGAVVDRRFDRARYDAARTIDAFGRSLRDEVSLEAIGVQLRAVTGATFRPAALGVVLVPTDSAGRSDDGP